MSTNRADQASTGGRSRIAVTALLVCAVALTAFLLALGIWQLERRVWKHELIARIEQRIHAPAVAAPGPASWASISADKDEYLRVQASGVLLNDKETLVQASTALGSGFWVMTPLRTADGFVVLVNRGFVPPEKRERASRAETETNAPVTVTGLLRISQPNGGFLRTNDAAADRWFSRDVQAIAARRELSRTAPYFIDADASAASAASAVSAVSAASAASQSTPQANASAGVWPAGGLTVISFPDNHLVYALTWFALALMTAGAGWLLLRRRPGAGAQSKPPILRGRGERNDDTVH